MQRDEEFQKHLMETFKLEAEEHLSGIVSGLLDLENEGAPERRGEIVETVFREAHSLKGAARSVGRSDIESLCQAMEGVFSALKRREVATSPELFDLLQRAGDLLKTLLVAEQRSDEEKALLRALVKGLAAASKPVGGIAQPEPSPPKTESVSAPASAKAAFTTGPTPAEAPPASTSPAAGVAAPAAPGTDENVPLGGAVKEKEAQVKPVAEPRTATAAVETVRVSWGKLSSVLLLSEEMLSAKLSSRQHALQMREIRGAFADWRKEWSKVVPELQRLGHDREILKLLDFLTWNSTFIRNLEGRYAKEAKRAEQDSRWLGGMVDNLLTDVKKAMMFPFSSLLDAFPKIVRDLSKDRGKEVDFVIKGEEIEIDRRILEEMKDPLIHLVRNCVDHGIEMPEERERKGKPRRGRVTVRIAPRDDKAEIMVSDDGGGVSPARLRSAIVKQGLVPAEKAQGMTDPDAMAYIFHSGVSTSPIVTDVSGHGLGLAIVKEKVEKLGGTVTLETKPDTGTTFRLLLPLSVATFRGILVRVGDRLFVLPATHVERAVRLKNEQIRSVENRQTVELSGAAVALERLETPLELPPAAGPSPGMLQAVVVTVGDQKIAFMVDEVLGEQEVLLKGLGPQLSRVRNIAGATVLGSGKVAPILNVADLMKSAAKRSAAVSSGPVASPEQGGAPARRKVLVVDDSITSRTLLKNILESGGYEVATAVDGVDGFTQLKGGGFDLLVSDVDMPRLNGFELTSRIRSDPALADLPVVLVTALGTREDREKGIDVGASAYIVKSSFDQSNLLEVVRRLC